MIWFKRFIKRNTHNFLFASVATLGRSINRLYENRNHDIHSNGEEWLIRKLSSIDPKIIFDVGANAGQYCMLLKRYCPSAHVYCFEPVTKTFELLQRNTKNLQGVTLIKSGLFNETKKMIINIYPHHTHASLFNLKAVPYKVNDTEEIQLVQGDHFIEENNIKHVDFLKLDIEGSELDALRGFEFALSNKLVRVFQFEYGYINITTKNLLVDYYELFQTHNYIVGKLYPKRIIFRKYNFKHEDFIGPNMIAIHKDDRELIKLLS